MYILVTSKLQPTDLPVQPTFGPSRGALKYPPIQGQIATATPLWSVLAGHGRQESAGSEHEQYVPAG